MNNSTQYSSDMRGTTMDKNVVIYLVRSYKSLPTPAQPWIVSISTPPTTIKSKIKPLFIADLGPNADMEEIRKNLKPMPKNPSFLKLIGSFSGPGDMSINKRKYISEHVRPDK